ncbi:carbohydrate porin [Sphingomonas hankookensis]|uniref:carbohydrate porin n=1 Tax=Sphingomonas hankookensis TaxID=563996 RepID=UPI001F5A9BC2|nr:carbohydrate porin [Sphingomonas hankookensis]
MIRRWIMGSAIGLMAGMAPAHAQEEAAGPVSLDFVYKGDVIGIAAGDDARGVRYLDNIDVLAAIDLDRVVGWQGGSAFASLLSNTGGRPNDLAGTLQGVDNIEVAGADLLLYQAWVQQSFAGDRVSILIGKYDLNSEFYASDAASHLIAPAFGIGSELSATGPNGPSIFPRTDLAVRLRAGDERNYVQAAAIRAPRGTADTGERRSTLFVGEAGWQGPVTLAIGGWAYSHRQPRIVPPGVSTGAGDAASHGVYAMVEGTIAGRADAPGHWRGFCRIGLSDGRTTPFAGGFQVGVTGQGIVGGRPESRLSLGIASADLSTPYRRANPAGEPPLTGSEGMVELTYSDQILPFLTLQPDAQYIRRPGGLRDAGDAVVVGLRAILAWKAL